MNAPFYRNLPYFPFGFTPAGRGTWISEKMPYRDIQVNLGVYIAKEKKSHHPTSDLGPLATNPAP